ncbi:hypothetical protein [Flavobacterium sp. CF136]|uniref:hypothetical protein n=1 Tax=Flavobacterium sp. (strain CF136) TaxID=1144313 RepID=UPI0002718586|nr:hypothetical protein [Flavobacterium sp. CF136]EJL62778.1 hypothetical protein PMI10_02735 [Flavobacterium sp. CF136]
MPNLITILLSERKVVMILFLLSGHLVFSQKIYEYNSPGANCYSQYLFKENAPLPKGVLVIDAKGEDLKTYSESNQYLNSGLFNDYNFLYINILDKENRNSLNCYNVVIYTVSYVRNINESVFFFVNPSQEIDPAGPFFIKNSSYSFNIINKSPSSLEILKTELNAALLSKTYKNPKVYSNEEIQAEKMSNYRRNFDVAFFYSPLIFFGPKLNSTSDVVGTYGLSFKKSIGSQTAVLLNLNMGSKKPDQSAIMEQVQSNQKGNIYSFVLFGGELMFRYYDNPDKPLRLFTSLGFGMYSMTNIRIKIKSTGVSAKTNENSYYTPVLDAGLEYRITPLLKVNSSVPLRYFINKSDNSINTFTMGINLGVSATINPNSFGKSGKKKN